MKPTDGFGSPSATGQINGKWGLGFGAKAPGAPGWPAGFGDKSAGGTITLVLNPTVTNGRMPDCGGDLLRAVAPWDVIGAENYRIQLRDHHTLQMWPQDSFGCWSTHFGEGVACTPDSNGLPFDMPPVPPGVYDLVVSWGPGYAQSAELMAAFRILWRNALPQAWALRGNFPRRFAVGPRASTAEPLLLKP